MNDLQQVGGAPIVGREAELLFIAAAMKRPGCRGVCLIGAAGVGKTRLADECRELARESGMAVVSASANAGSARIPLGALAHLLPPASELGDLHQDLQPAHLLQSARKSLAAGAGDRRLVLSIDDAHHLDPVAAQLVYQLVSVDSAFLIATLRTGEKIPSPIAELLLKATVDRLDLQGLKPDAVVPIARDLLGGALDGPSLSWLTVTSAGNALFLRELVLSARDDGTLVLDPASKLWRLQPGRRPSSPRLTELLEHRLDGLSIDERRALEVIALAEPLPLEPVEELLGLDVLDALDRRGLVRVLADGKRLTIGLCHPLYVEIIRRSPMSLRKRVDLGALASAIQAAGGRRREDPIRIATWQLAVGGRADPEVLLRAALAAQLGFDDHTAIDLAGAGLQQDPSADVRIELLLCRGLGLSRLGRFQTATPDLIGAYETATSPVHVSRSAIRLAAATLERDGDLQSAIMVLDNAIVRLPDGPELVDVRLERATLLADAGFPAAAADELGLVDEAGQAPAQRIMTALARGSERLNAGFPLEAVDVADAGLHIHLSHPTETTTYHPTSHFLPRILGLIESGQLDVAERDARWIQQRGAEERRPIAETGGCLFAAMVLLRRGQTNACVKAAEEALTTSPSDNQPYMRRLAWALLARAHVLRGDVGSAVASLREFDQAPQVVDGFGEVEYVLARSQVRGAGSDRDGARAVLQDALVDADTRGNWRVTMNVLDELMHAHLDRDAAAMVAQSAQRSPDALSQARALQAWSMLDGDVRAHVDAATRFLELGFNVRAAEISASAARDAKRHGDTRSAARLERIASSAVGRMDGVLTPSITGYKAAVPLTDREREIASLVSRGATSKEVGLHLNLSARTVDNHLQRVFAKLGVSGRRELRAAIGQSTFE